MTTSCMITSFMTTSYITTSCKEYFLALCADRGPKDQKEVYLEMHKYELTVVISSKVDDDVRTATIEQIKELIARFGGTVLNVDDWGKRRLAYEIQKMKEAYYYFITFEGDSTLPNEMEQRVRIMENVIRYLIVRQDA